MSPTPLSPNFPIDVRGGRRIKVSRVGGTALRVDAEDGSFDNGVLAAMPALTFKGNPASGAGQPQDVTPDTAKQVLGLSRVDDTADADKVAAGPIAEALDLKAARDYTRPWSVDPTTLPARVKADREVFAGPDIDNTGANECTTQLTNAIAQMAGRHLYLPPGKFDYLGALPINVSKLTLEGAGRQTVLASRTAGVSDILVGTGSAAIEGLILKSFVLWPNQDKAAGTYGIHFRQVYHPIVHEIYCGTEILVPDGVGESAARHYNAFFYDRFFNVKHTGGASYVKGAQATHFKFRGNTNGSFGTEARVTGGARQRYGNTAFWVGGGTGGIYLGDNDCASMMNGIVYSQDLLREPRLAGEALGPPGTNDYGPTIARVAANANRELFAFPDCVIDSVGNVCVLIDQGLQEETNPAAGGAQILLLNWNCSSVRGYTGPNAPGSGIGIDIVNAKNHCITISGRIYNNAASGVVVRDPAAKVDVGGQILSNGRYAVEPVAPTSNTRLSPVANCFGNVLGTWNSNLADPASAEMPATKLIHGVARSWSLDNTLVSLSIAAGQSQQLPVGGGFLCLVDEATGSVGFFLVGGGFVKLLGQSNASGPWTDSTSPTSSQINVAYNPGAGRYQVGNPTTGARTIGLLSGKVRASS